MHMIFFFPFHHSITQLFVRYIKLYVIVSHLFIYFCMCLTQSTQILDWSTGNFQSDKKKYSVQYKYKIFFIYQNLFLIQPWFFFSFKILNKIDWSIIMSNIIIAGKYTKCLKLHSLIWNCIFFSETKQIWF